MENYQKYLNPQTLASLEGLDLQARMVVEGYVAGHAPQPVPRLLRRVRRAPRVRARRRHPPRRLEGLVEDRQALPEAVRGGDEPPHSTCCWTRASRWPTPRARTSSKLQYAQFVAAALAYMVLQQQDSVGLATFDDAVRRYLKPAGQPSHLKELLHVHGRHPGPARSRTWGSSSTTWPSGSRSGAWWSILSDLFDDVPADPRRPEALPAPPPRGDRLPHPRPGRARVPVPRHDAVQGAGRAARGPDRAARPAAGLPGRDRRRSSTS